MALEKFHYDSPHGKITATRMQNLPMGIARKARKLEPSDALFEMIEAALDAKSLTVFDKLDREQFAAFQQAWTEDSGVSLGESSASSTS